jgi:hypothetical protein
MAGGGRYVQRETLKAFGQSSRLVFNPGFGADRHVMGLNSPFSWKANMTQAINRRSLITALAVLPAAAAPGRAQSAPAVPEMAPKPSHALQSPAERAAYHLAAYKAAVREIDPTITGFARMVPEDDGDVAWWLMARRS